MTHNRRPCVGKPMFRCEANFFFLSTRALMLCARKRTSLELIQRPASPFFSNVFDGDWLCPSL